MQKNDIRRRELVAAAEVLMDWIHARRAAWPDSELAPEVPHFEAPEESPYPMAVPPLVVPLETPRTRSAAPVPYHAPVPDEIDEIEEPPPARVKPKSEPARPRVRMKIPTAAIWSLVEPPLRWSMRLGVFTLRLGVFAAILAIVVGAGWLARPYVMELARPYLLKLKTTPTTGMAVLESAPAGSEVLVDGVSVGKTPMTTELAAGNHVVEFRRNKRTRTLEIDVVGGQSTTARLDWNAVQTGRLTARSEPAGAQVLIDGRARGVTPLTLEDLSVGSHVVVIQSPQGSVRRTVTVTSDRAAVVSESIFPGFLKLFAPFELQITEGTRTIRLDDQSQVLLPPGTHELRFENRTLGYTETRRVDVLPGATTSLSLVPSPSRLNVTANMPATVLVDGQQVGETPLTNHPIPLGTRDIIVRSADGVERRFSQTVTVAPVQIDVNF